MKRFGLFVLLLATACGPRPVISDSPALHQWTAKEWEQILTAEKALPGDSILIPVLEDYIGHYDTSRAVEMRR